MSLELSPLLERFAERSPLPVLVRALLERCLNPQQLDAWFARVAEAQYTRKLLFSTLFDLMGQVVLRQQRSVHAAYRASVADIGVSVTAVYDKLNGLEPGISAGLVEYSAAQAGALIEVLEVAPVTLLPGRRVKILDGNTLAGREHRLRETRASSAAPLPGQALAVLDAPHGLITALYPCEDAYTQERALAMRAVLPDVAPGEVWIADRNFCTRGFLEGLAERGAEAVIREHDQLPFTPHEPMHEVGRIETGRVAEQRGQLGAEGLAVRRIAVYLDTPTRDGEDTLYLITTVPSEVADAATLATLYRERWTVEKAFLHLTQELRCEVDTLAHPPAALFAFACAALTYNVLAVVRAALCAAHGRETVEQLSGYYMAIELGNHAESLETILDAEDWAPLRTAALDTFADWLRQQAARMNLRRYRKSRRGPKKPPPERVHDPKRPHVSVARILRQRRQSRAP
jgi:hypothetical protein